MKRTYINLLGLVLIGAIISLVSCEGPEGPMGKDGSESCAACHNAGTDFTLKQVQFGESAHSLGTYYSRGGQCSGCHSTEGFLARADFTSISQIDDLAEDVQTPISCRTCHNVHMAYDSTDWALTIDDQVTETLLGYSSPNVEQTSFNDYGSGNQCLQCHQSRDRGNIPSVTSTDAVGTSSHWGPHYGVQGNVMHGNAGVHIVGTSSYPSSHPHQNLSKACINCHMHEGSHTLEVNYDACTACHSDADAAETMVEELETEIHDLLFELGDLLATAGAMSANMEGDVVTGYSPVSGDISADLARAVWNYMVVYQDHSYGTHHPSYVKALLNNSIESLK